MTVFVLIPVFNRLEHTRRVIEALRQQTLVAQIETIIIDDGSSDGTAEFLRHQDDVTTLTGDGHLWWGGGIQRGLRYACRHWRAGDYVLFMNNDTWVDPDYVETLIQVSREQEGAAVGSVIREDGSDQPLSSIGPRLNITEILVWDLLSELPEIERGRLRSWYTVDALSGRGTLYPVELFERHGMMRPRLLPHYLADYEVSMRFKRAGTPLLVSSKAVVYSPPVYGNAITHLSWWERCFSRRSSVNILRLLIFYMLVGSPMQRLTAPLRILYFPVYRRLIRWRQSGGGDESRV